MIKYELSTSCRWRLLSSAQYSYISERVVQLLGRATNCPTYDPYCAPPRKIPFINMEKPFNGCQRSVHKY